METNKDADLTSLELLDPQTGKTEMVESDPLGKVDFGGALFSEATGYQTQQFTCSVANVTWSVDGVAGGNASVGTISTNGLSAPPAVGDIHVVKATTAAAPHVSDSVTVAVTDLAGVFT
jgi:hypothetical protein